MSMTHALGLLAHPTREWHTIREESCTEQPSILNFILTYLLFITAIPAVCGYLGTTLTGWQLPGSPETVYLTHTSAAIIAVLSYFATLAAILATSGFVHWMARTFDVSPSFAQCLTFTAYTATPLLVGGLAALSPSLWLAMIVGIIMIGWSAYLLYTGIPVFMNIPFERGVIFASSVLCVALVVLVATMAISVTLWNLGAGPIYL